MTRPDWDPYFMNLMEAAAARSTCDRGKPACVIVNKNHQILATGYAGSPPGLPHCDEVGHKFEETRYVIPSASDKTLTTEQLKLIAQEKMEKDLMSNVWVGPSSMHCVRTIHAEINAINQAAKCGHSIDGAICLGIYLHLC